jgi:hypothetical protein
LLLKAEKKDAAIRCSPGCGPDFNNITVKNNCNANIGSYRNDARPDMKMFFAGSQFLQVNESEVFEITDETALPLNPVLKTGKAL